jgi:membrane protein implicated in regulation of membrane protease activity
MAKRLLIAVILIAVLAGVGVYVAWAVGAASKLGAGWAGLDTAWPYLLAGVLTVGVAIAGFLRLAFWSQSRGYDDRADIERDRRVQRPRT